MAYRTDVTIDFNASPRIITVASPATSITVQDLVDTIRHLEAENPTYAKLIDTAGKTFLYNDGISDFYTGIVLTLLNAQVAFAARSGPTYTQCQINAGDIVAQNDVGGVISPVYPTAFTQVLVSQSTAPTLVVTAGSGGAGASAAEIWAYADRQLTSTGNAAVATAIRTELTPELTHVLLMQNGLTSTQATLLQEIYTLYGLDPTKPLIVTDTNRTAGTVIQNITSNTTQTTVQRV